MTLNDLVIIFGGGRDSLLVLDSAVKKYRGDITLLLYDYGQKSFKREEEAIRYYGELYKVNYLTRKVTLSIPKSIETGESDSSGYVTLRNVILLSMAINLFYPYVTHYGVGATAGERYNDGIAVALRDLEKVVSYMHATPEEEYPIKLYMPLETIHWKDINKEIAKRNIDVSKMWFCMTDNETHCGKCEKCVAVMQKIEGYEKFSSRVR